MKATLLATAGNIGRNARRLEADMANPEWQTIIDRNRALAKDLGISGTPGLIVGTELVPEALDGIHLLRRTRLLVRLAV